MAFVLFRPTQHNAERVPEPMEARARAWQCALRAAFPLTACANLVVVAVGICAASFAEALVRPPAALVDVAVAVLHAAAPLAAVIQPVALVNVAWAGRRGRAGGWR